MEVEIKHVSGKFEKDSTIVVDVFVKGLTSKISFANVMFGLDPETAFKLIGATNDLFSPSPQFYPQKFGFVPKRPPMVLLENKNGIERYTPIELHKSGFLVRAEFSVLRTDRDSMISVLKVRLAEDPITCITGISSNMSLVFS